MQERKNSIKDFIGIYDGYIPDEACDQAIELFKKYQEFNKIFSRFSSEGATQDFKNDKQLFCTGDVLTDEEFNVNKLKALMINFDMALRHYYTETNIKKYGFKTPSENQDIKDKTKYSNIIRNLPQLASAICFDNLWFLITFQKAYQNLTFSQFHLN